MVEKKPKIEFLIKNFDGLTQLEKLFYLGLEICISIIIYFGISKAINGNGLKGMMN